MKTTIATIIGILLFCISFINNYFKTPLPKKEEPVYISPFLLNTQETYLVYDYRYCNEVYEDTNMFSSIQLYRYIKQCGIYHSKIVYAQAIHETGGFKSNVFKSCNNLFGFMKDSITYMDFENWKASVQYYKTWQDRKYKPLKYKSYYEFSEQKAEYKVGQVQTKQ